MRSEGFYGRDAIEAVNLLVARSDNNGEIAASKKVESFMTDDIAYGLTFTLAILSGISMGSFYTPFITNCIAEWLKKVDAHYQSYILDPSHIRSYSETSSPSRRSEAEDWDHDLLSPDIEVPVQSRAFAY